MVSQLTGTWLQGATATWLAAAATERAELSRRRRTEVFQRPGGFLDLASNDYLGLSRDPRLIEAATIALREYGCGSRASPVVTGRHAVHAELERALCTLTDRPTALIFSSGYLANLGALTALTGRGAVIFSDEHAHASLIDAAKLSRARVEVFPHSDLRALEMMLQVRQETRAVVVVESIYSVLGDAAPLRELAQLCARFDALLLVDEAHGLGVSGSGRGGVWAAGLAKAEHVVVTVTLSKSLGAQGGAVLAGELVREHLLNTARSFIFDTALAPASAAAAGAACQIIVVEPQRVAKLHQVAGAIAQAAGIEASAGAVQSLRMANAAQAEKISLRLRAEGILVGCFRPPSVPDGISRLRFTARADVAPAEAAQAAVLARLWVRATREIQ